jgi:hypothetical protein
VESQWKNNGNEVAVKICKAQKGLNIFDGARLGPGADQVELLGVHLDTIHADYITEVGDLGPVKVALLRVSKEASFLKPVEHFLDMLVMFFLGTREDQNIVKINNTKDIKVIAQRIHDEGLESRRRIRKAKIHDKSFEQAERGTKGCLPLIAFLDSDEVEGVLEVDDRKNLAALCPVKKIVNKR